MNVIQSIQNPFGINVFGSAIVRIEPDLASLTFAVSSLKQHPKEAFQEVRQATQKVRQYLAQAQMSEVGSSRISLAQSYRYPGGEQRFVGYTAKVAFHVLLRDLERMEEVLAGVVEVGVNEINAVEFQTSQLKEIRAKARQRAVEAAREKAEIYCQVAGVTLGAVIHIEDVNPDQLRGREGHVMHESPTDDEGPLRAFDPGSIVVGAAVMIAFKIEG